MEYASKYLQEQSGIRIVCDKILPVASKTAQYLLLEDASRFLLECRFGGEKVTVSLGKSFAFAAYVYEQIVQGEVTPCTVTDIVEDLRQVWSKV